MHFEHISSYSRCFLPKKYKHSLPEKKKKNPLVVAKDTSDLLFKL